MTPFRFRLETLLRMRAALRDQRRRHLAEAEQAVALIVEQIEQLGDDAARARRELERRASPGEIDVDALRARHRHELMLAAQRRALELQRSRLEEEVAQRRAVLIEADREVRVLEKLRERRQEAFRREEEARDIKLMDEIALRGATRGGAPS